MKRLRVLVASISLMVSVSANALIVEYVYTGIVSGNQGTSDAIQLHDAVTASIMYDTTKVNYAEIYADAAYYYFNRNVPFDDIDQDAFRIALSVEASDGNTYSGSSHVGVVQVENDVPVGPNGMSDILRPSSINDHWAPSVLAYYQSNDLPYKDRVAGDPILGMEWDQITMYLRDDGASVSDDVSLPETISNLNDLDAGIFEVSLDVGGSFKGFVADIVDVQAILSTSVEGVTVTDILTDVIVDPGDLINGAGGMQVQLPSGVQGSLGATYRQQAAEELDYSLYDFLIAGAVMQLWDVDFDDTLIPEGEFVKVVLSYDDSFMNGVDEATLQVLHILDDGTSGGLLQVTERNIAANTITVLTPGFSSLTIVAGDVPVPIPAPAVLLGLGLALIGFSRYRNLGNE